MAPGTPRWETCPPVPPRGASGHPRAQRLALCSATAEEEPSPQNERFLEPRPPARPPVSAAARGFARSPHAGPHARTLLPQRQTPQHLCRGDTRGFCRARPGGASPGWGWAGLQPPQGRATPQAPGSWDPEGRDLGLSGGSESLMRVALEDGLSPTSLRLRHRLPRGLRPRCAPPPPAPAETQRRSTDFESCRAEERRQHSTGRTEAV